MTPRCPFRSTVVTDTYRFCYESALCLGQKPEGVADGQLMSYEECCGYHLGAMGWGLPSQCTPCSQGEWLSTWARVLLYIVCLCVNI